MRFFVFLSMLLIPIIPIGCNSTANEPTMTNVYTPLSSDITKIEKIIAFPQKPKSVLFRYMQIIPAQNSRIDIPIPAQDNTRLYALVTLDEQSIAQMKASFKGEYNLLHKIDQLEIKQLLEKKLSPAELQPFRKSNFYQLSQCYSDNNRLFIKRGDFREVCFLTKTEAFFEITF